MHHTLEVLDILEVIFAFISDNFAKRRGNNTLVALATTCRTFRDPALKELWKALSDLPPLIKCLPAEIWSRRGIISFDLVCKITVSVLSVSS